MTVTAKFKVKSILHNDSGRLFSFEAVYSADKNSENYSWSKYTPYGKLEMLVSNPDVNFELGESYVLTFTKAS
jgi:hypothetical protein